MRNPSGPKNLIVSSTFFLFFFRFNFRQDRKCQFLDHFTTILTSKLSFLYPISILKNMHINKLKAFFVLKLRLFSPDAGRLLHL